jgi:hypothetical protein
MKRAFLAANPWCHESGCGAASTHVDHKVPVSVARGAGSGHRIPTYLAGFVCVQISPFLWEFIGR